MLVLIDGAACLLRAESRLSERSPAFAIERKKNLRDLPDLSPLIPLGARQIPHGAPEKTPDFWNREKQLATRGLWACFESNRRVLKLSTCRKTPGEIG
jgi:hypothetical protein